MPDKKKNTIKLVDSYVEGKKRTKHMYNRLRRFGYWAIIAILLAISVVFSTLAIGDVYKLNDISVEEIINLYETSGHIVTPKDKTIISDIVIEVNSKEDIIDFNEYNNLFERIQSYNYENSDGDEVRFDTIMFYLYTRTNQKLFSLQTIEEWRLALIIINSILALLMTITFMKTGIQDGLNVKELKDKRKELIDISMIASKKRLYADYYFNKLYLNKLSGKRETLLLDAGLLYTNYFDEDGLLKKDLELNEMEEKALKKVLSVKINKLSYDKLVNHGNVKGDNETHRDIDEYQKTTAIYKIIVKIVMVMIFTFVSVSLIVTAQSGRQILLNLVSVFMSFIAGFLEYLNSYTFIVDEYSETLDFQIRELSAFVEWDVPKHLINEIKYDTIEEEIDDVSEVDIKEGDDVND